MSSTNPSPENPPLPIRIAPSILSADFGRLAAEVEAITAAGADQIHVDVMDGHFVPNLTIGPMVVKALRKATRLPLDVHLMIERPELWVEEYARAGADILYVHPEACVHLHRVLQQIRAAGKQPAVAINPSTPLSCLEWILEDITAILVMSVNPGFGGQSFIPQVLRKIEELRDLLRVRRLSQQVTIAVDGGIKLDNIAEVARAGATTFISGSGIFETKSYAETIAAMKDRAQHGACG
ncbi:MAG: ribulose-phosphate 3-epimerase [Polyangia bacterium]